MPPAILGAFMRYLALDVGERRIGVALSDETATLASGLDTVTRGGGKKDFAAIAALVERHRPAAVLVGLPLNMDGTAGAQAEKVRTFVEGLKQRVGEYELAGEIDRTSVV